MRPSPWVVAAGVLALLAVSTPAHADTTTTHDTTDVVAYSLPGAVAFPDLIPPGAAVFPYSVALPPTTQGRASGIRVAAPPSGCIRLVNSMTLAFTATWQQGPTTFQIAQIASSAGNLDPDARVTYVGSGIDSSHDPAYANIDITDSPAAGTATMTYDRPIQPDEGLLGVYMISPYGDSNWTISSVRFNVTDTCTEAVTAPAATLPATGVDATTTGLAALLLLGAGVLGVRRARRS